MRAHLSSFVMILVAFVTGCTLPRLSLRESLYIRVWMIRDLSDPPNMVSLIFSVENRGNRFIELTLRGRPAHDFIIYKPDGAEVWRWSYRETVQPVLIPKILNPGDYLKFEAKWDQQDNQGILVPPGKYLLQGLLNIAPDRTLKTPPTPLWAGSKLVLISELELPSLAFQDNKWKRYWKLGRKLPLKLKLKNISDHPVELTLIGCPAHDFVIDQDDKEIWRWSHDKPTLEITGFKTLNPDEELEFETEWDQRDNEGNPISPGTYLVRGIWNVSPFGKLEAEGLVNIGPGLPLRLTLELPKEMPAGESVPFKLKIENTMSKVLNLEVGYAPYDFIVTTPDGAEVWRWSYGKAFPLVTRPLILQPNEVKEFSETWDQLDKEGYPVLAGAYNVYGTFRASQLEGLFETEQSELQKLIIKP
jgi:hypothetical protein